MTEINKPKLNLDALKWNILKNKAENQEKKDIIEKKSVDNTNKTPTISTQKENLIKTENINKKQENNINNNINKNIDKKQDKNKNIINKQNQKNINPFNKKTENIDPIQRITENIDKKEENIKKENNNTTENIVKEQNNSDLQNIEDIKKDENINKEIFSWYTSDFLNKKEEAIKESKKIKLPDSPKKIFFAIFSSLLILSSLAFIIIFKIDNPITKKLKTNILEIVWQKTQKIEKKEINKIIKDTWTTKQLNQFWFIINYQLSNTNKYKIDWKILNNKDNFNKYIQNKLEKLKLEKLKKHIQEEKEKNTNSK